ncbi:hypothetical protein BAE44_0023178, partial [Dichanthelium oligosanthes]
LPGPRAGRQGERVRGGVHHAPRRRHGGVPVRHRRAIRHTCPSGRRCTTMARSGRRTASSWTAIRRRGPGSGTGSEREDGRLLREQGQSSGGLMGDSSRSPSHENSLLYSHLHGLPCFFNFC